jgi:hypothetical protein
LIRNHILSLTAGGLAARSVNILCQVCLPPARLRAPVSLGVSAVSSRTLVSNAGWRLTNDVNPWTPGEWNHTVIIRLTS